MTDVTRILNAIEAGDQHAAADLLPHSSIVLGQDWKSRLSRTARLCQLFSAVVG
jgi:hypothetical protein